MPLAVETLRQASRLLRREGEHWGHPVRPSPVAPSGSAMPTSAQVCTAHLATLAYPVWYCLVCQGPQPYGLQPAVSGEGATVVGKTTKPSHETGLTMYGGCGVCYHYLALSKGCDRR